MTTAVSASQSTAYQAPLNDAAEITAAQAPKDDFGLSDIAASLAEIERTSSSVTSEERPIISCIANLLSAMSRLIAAFKDVPTTDEWSNADTNDSPIDANTDLTTTPESGSADAIDSSSGTSSETEASSPGSSTEKTEKPEKTGSEVTTPENTRVQIGTLLGKTGDFLWKPQSDKDHKLAVLLPKGLTGKIKSVSILSPDKKKVLQTGKYSGVGNGGREHFRFTKAGSAFPDGAIVLIKLNDGTSKHVTIKDTGARTIR